MNTDSPSHSLDRRQFLALAGGLVAATALSAADILRARDEKRLGVIYGFQNAAQVGTDPTRIDIFADLGVRVIQLTYNPRNQLGDSSIVAENHGLTPLGREVVARLNARRVMVDLSHSGEQICLDAARASTQPISINHTGCRALTDLPRNKTDAELRLVAERGGFVGIYFMPFLEKTGHAHADDVVRHIVHAVQICGEDHVGLGTDGSATGIDDLEAYRERAAKKNAARTKAGIAAPGEGPDVFPVHHRPPRRRTIPQTLRPARGARLQPHAHRKNPRRQLPPFRPRRLERVTKFSRPGRPVQMRPAAPSS